MKEQPDWNLARKHAAVVRWVVARHLERVAKLEASGFSTVRAEQAFEVLLRVLKLFEERERKLCARATQRRSSAPRCASPPLVPSGCRNCHARHRPWPSPAKEERRNCNFFVRYRQRVFRELSVIL